jgi:hypothetical protein
VVALVALALLPLPTIQRDGIGWVHLYDSPAFVKAVLGEPARIRRYRGPGPDLDDWVYPQRGMTVELLKDGGRPYVYSVATTNPSYRTREGAHVGSRERVVRLSAPYCHDDPYNRSRYCSNVNEGGVGGTFWRIRRGRAVSVTVAAPVY